MGIPSTDIDMFSADSVRNARAVDDGIREMAPVVYLERENIAMLGRHEHVAKGLAPRGWWTGKRSPAPRGPGTIPTPCVPRFSSPTIRRATPRCAP